MKKDITSTDDIELLINTFYDKVRNSVVIGPIFNDIIQVDWKEHLPIMYSFWSSILLGAHSYTGNPMQKHIALSKMTTLSEIEFSEWLLLFTQTVDELFEGATARDAKKRAANIARLMLHNIQNK
jgi:hemoglobin